MKAAVVRSSDQPQQLVHTRPAWIARPKMMPEHYTQTKCLLVSYHANAMGLF